MSIKNRRLWIFNLSILWIAVLLAGCQAAPPPAPQPPPIETAGQTSPTTPEESSTTAALQSSPTPMPSPTADASPVATETTEIAAPTSPPAASPTAEATLEDEPPPATATSSPTQPAASPTPSASQPGEHDSASQACTDIAAFYGDLTVPDDTIFAQGETFEKGWQLRNNGSCTWGTGYAVVFHSGDPLGAASTNPLPTSVAPGETVDIFLPMQAPRGGGTYYSNWELQNADGQRFGTGSARADKFWVRIQINWVPPPGAGGEVVIIDPGQGGGSSGGSSGSLGGCQYTTDPGFAQTVIALINQARANNGLPPLIENPALSSAAQVHSLDMACNNHFSHTGSDGSSWPQRIAAQGYSAGLALENVYSGDPSFGGTPQGAVNWWLGSEIHLANILNPQVTEIGVGYVASPQATYIGRLTAVFARP